MIQVLESLIQKQINKNKNKQYIKKLIKVVKIEPQKNYTFNDIISH